MIIRTVAVKCDRRRCRTKLSRVNQTAEGIRQIARWADWTTGKRGDFCPKHKAGSRL